MPIRRLAILSLLAVASTALAQTQPATQPFDPAAYPRDADLSPLSPEQRRQVMNARLGNRAPRPHAAATKPATPQQPQTTDDRASPAAAGALAPEAAAAVRQLDDRDPEVRRSAREALMSLTRDDLPRLRDAVAGTATSTTRRDALRDVVIHVYLTGKHRFAGAAVPYLGVMATPAAGEPPTVMSRTIGYDAYRALRPGDVIVGLRVPPRRGEAEGAFVEIRSFATVRDLLAGAVVGQWVGVRLIRDGGTPVETRVRIGPRSPAVDNATGTNGFFPEAMNYWTSEFAPALAATRPAEPR